MVTLISAGGALGGPHSGERRCDARCHEAHEPRCDCICHGRHHGKGLGQRRLFDTEREEMEMDDTHEPTPREEFAAQAKALRQAAERAEQTIAEVAGEQEPDAAELTVADLASKRPKGWLDEVIRRECSGDVT